jgi:hypothetical protein
MFKGIDPKHFKAIQILLLHVIRRRFQYYLILIVMLQPIRVLTVATVCGPPGRLDISDIPWLRAKCPQQSGWMKCSGTNFNIIRLGHNTPLLSPELL